MRLRGVPNEHASAAGTPRGNTTQKVRMELATLCQRGERYVSAGETQRSAFVALPSVGGAHTYMHMLGGWLDLPNVD